IKLKIRDEMKAYSPISFWLGKAVRVKSVSADISSGSIQANSIELLEANNRGSAIIGSQPWVSLLCKFNDINSEPRDLNFFQGMYANMAGGLDHYWRELSYDKANVAGSTAIDWVTLPSPQTTYMSTPGSGQDSNLNLLFDDCTAAADSFIDFSDADGNGNSFVGINLMFNDVLDCCAWGGGRFSTLDGVSKLWRTTWNPPWSYAQEGIISHEMGHGFGLPHTNNSDLDSSPYDNVWDVMSMPVNHAVIDPVYGRLGKHINAYHKRRLEWIESTESFTVNGETNSTIIIDDISIASTTNYRMARINLVDNSYYTVEARKTTGNYEANLPGTAIIIHHVTSGRSEPSWVIDADDPPGDTSHTEGVMWKVGETFIDTVNDLELSVLSETANGFEISIIVTDIIFSDGFE
ncbi:MAG: hypothetical protein L3J52_05605, partial [Proteobacteria bacterium]|nr:hypothetical protein [Pseudomonadota bacterium]